MISLLVVVFFVLIIAGVPLAFGTGLAALSYCLTADIPITIIAQKIFTTSNSTTMLAIPCTIGEISVVKAIKAVWPFVLALLVSIVITMYVPILTNFIPNVLL